MSINFIPDTSPQLGGTFTSGSIYSGYITSNSLSNVLLVYDLIIDRSYSITNLSNVLQGNINSQEAILSFSSPLTRNTNTIGIDLSSYLTTSTASTTYFTIANSTTLSNTLTSNINTKQAILTTTTILLCWF